MPTGGPSSGLLIAAVVVSLVVGAGLGWAVRKVRWWVLLLLAAVVCRWWCRRRRGGGDHWFAGRCGVHL